MEIAFQDDIMYHVDLIVDIDLIEHLHDDNGVFDVVEVVGKKKTCMRNMMMRRLFPLMKMKQKVTKTMFFDNYDFRI